MWTKKAVKIIVASHKSYQMPTDSMYLPLYVGASEEKKVHGNKQNFGYTRDDTGENISYLNPFFCELTGLYWAWKNLDADYIGLVHYRRHFSLNGRNGFENVLTYQQLNPYLRKVKVFVPNKRKYYIETLYSHYVHTHYSNQLDETRKIIVEKYPEYVKSYDVVLRHTYGYMFNMMIMDKSLLNDYCQWLFDILFELKKRSCVLELSDFQKRFYGGISEIIFNVWLYKKINCGEIRKNEVMEIPYIHMEKINWWKKGSSFLQAKFMGKKYEGSF